MKYKKILFLFLLLLTGCNVNYDLSINPDSSVNEKVTVQIEDTDQNYDVIDQLFKNKNISKENYKIVRDVDDLNITYNYKYDSVEDYILNSEAYKQVFDKIDLEKTKTKTKLSTSADFSKNNDISVNKDGENNIEYLQINIKSSLPVLSENSDTINDQNYTWIYNGKQTQKNIEITMNNTASIMTFKSIIVIITIVLSVTLMSLIIYKRFKERQKF